MQDAPLPPSILLGWSSAPVCGGCLKPVELRAEDARKLKGRPTICAECAEDLLETQSKETLQ